VTNALPARKDSRVRETVLSPVAPQGFPGQTNLIDFGFNGFPDPLRASPGLELLKSAAFFIDAANAKTGDAYAYNKGTGGFALDARYGSSLAIGASDTNDPLLLPFNGETYVYLPGSASNTIACTAPVGTASFAAYPTGGGAATTGAAVAGAFTLQTTGSWIRIDILDAGTAVIASFVAANSTSTGYTDAFAVVWTINRATSGRKSALVARPVWLFGPDDYMEVADNALINFNATDSFTIVLLMRHWGNLEAFGGALAKGGNTTVSDRGYLIEFQGSGSAKTYMNAAGDTNATDNGVGGTYTYGALTVHAHMRDISSGFIRRYYNNVTTQQSDAGTGTLTNTLALRVGSRTDGVGTAFSADMELLAVAIFRRALSATEIASINTYYGTA
jgi:hypothetical protein